MIWNNNTNSVGSVVLAGAGPGDPDLITVKLQKCLALADVIIADRLVNPILWEQYAKPQMELILAGKQGYNEASLSQEQVTGLILHHAIKGNRVLRLKGGDVAFFSNVLDELEKLVERNIPYQIIPGITAASGASAYLGMPLTAREFAQGVQFISFNPNAVYDESHWKRLAKTDDTLVLYMASKNLELFLTQMLGYGADPHCPIAVIEQATTLHQQFHASSLGRAHTELLGKSYSSPSLVVVGKVIDLHKRFAWFEPKEKGSVFLSL